MEANKGHLILMMALAILLGVPQVGPVAQAQQQEILIGGTTSQSGRFLGIVKPFGKLAEVWAQRVNKRGGLYLSQLGKSLPIRFVLYDDQSSPPIALKFYERMATVDKVNAFIGPFSSFITNAALQATVTHKIPFFMSEANDSIMFQKPNKWRTTGLAPAQWEYKRVAEFYRRRGGVKKFALLAWDNLHDKQAMEGLGDWLRKFGFEVVYQNVGPKDTRDFSSIILKIKQTKPDVVFVEAISPPWTIGFLKQARELGLNPKDVIAGHASLVVIKGMGKSMENVMSAMYSFAGETPDHKEYLDLCRAAGFEPWQFSESGIRYNSYRRIEDALKRAGSLDKEAIRRAMWETNLPLFGGKMVVKHDSRGYGTLHPWPTQIQGGKHVSLWPVDDGVKVHRFKSGKW